jgi:hypothetical protein
MLATRPPQPPARGALPPRSASDPLTSLFNDDEAMAVAKGEHGPAILVLGQQFCGGCTKWKPVVEAAAAAAAGADGPVRFFYADHITAMRTGLLLDAVTTPWTVGIVPGDSAPRWLYLAAGERSPELLTDLLRRVAEASAQPRGEARDDAVGAVEKEAEDVPEPPPSSELLSPLPTSVEPAPLDALLPHSSRRARRASRSVRVASPDSAPVVV